MHYILPAQNDAERTQKSWVQSKDYICFVTEVWMKWLSLK